MYYQLCQICEAKFFTPVKWEICRRCGHWSYSTDERIVPWETLQADATLQRRGRAPGLIEAFHDDADSQY